MVAAGETLVGGEPTVDGTMIEPVTGAWFQLVLLTYTGLFDMRFPDLE